MNSPYFGPVTGSSAMVLIIADVVIVALGVAYGIYAAIGEPPDLMRWLAANVLTWAAMSVAILPGHLGSGWADPYPVLGVGLMTCGMLVKVVKRRRQHAWLLFLLPLLLIAPSLLLIAHRPAAALIAGAVVLTLIILTGLVSFLLEKVSKHASAQL